MIDKASKKVSHKAKETADNGARRAVLEDLFYDFHKRRGQVYWMNFVRGLFFGVGSVLGGTVIIATVLWILTLLVDLPGGIGDFIQSVVNTVSEKQQ